MFSVGRVIADPGQGRLRQLLHRTKKIGLYFTRSHRPSLTRTSDVVDVNFCTRTTIANGSKCNTSGGNTRRLLEKEKRFFCVRCFSKKLSLSWGRKGIGETPQCGSTRRLTSRPRKALCISVAVKETN